MMPIPTQERSDLVFSNLFKSELPEAKGSGTTEHNNDQEIVKLWFANPPNCRLFFRFYRASNSASWVRTV